MAATKSEYVVGVVRTRYLFIIFFRARVYDGTGRNEPSVVATPARCPIFPSERGRRADGRSLRLPAIPREGLRNKCVVHSAREANEEKEEVSRGEKERKRERPAPSTRGQVGPAEVPSGSGWLADRSAVRRL